MEDIEGRSTVDLGGKRGSIFGGGQVAVESGTIQLSVHCASQS